MSKTDKEKSKGLAQQLLDLMDEVITLTKETPDLKTRKELTKLRKAISNEAGRIIEANLSKSTKDYRAATVSLEKASQATREAIENVQSVKHAIDCIAKAVDLACKVAA